MAPLLQIAPFLAAATISGTFTAQSFLPSNIRKLTLMAHRLNSLAGRPVGISELGAASWPRAFVRAVCKTASRFAESGPALKNGSKTAKGSRVIGHGGHNHFALHA